jgi:hypothetical protein
VIGEVSDGIMQTFASNVEAMLTGGGPSPQASAPAASTDAAAPAASTGAGQPAAGFAGTGGDDLDAWGLVIRPMLQKHAGSLVTIAVSTVGAYLGARAGARAGSRGRSGRPAYRHN